jgi:hypothetical protein
MKPLDLLVYSLIGLSSLVIAGYAVHMLIGGLVSEETEYRVIAGVCSGLAIVLGAMAWDISKRQR